MASSSPYRRSLLERLNIVFGIESPDIDESQLENESAQELVLRLAYEKAAQVAKNQSAGLVIGSDQVAECEKMILGKPGNYENARQQLMTMSGKAINFHTGLCLYDVKTGNHEKDVILYTVYFRDLSDSEIESYLKHEEPYNCAGSFKSEGLGITLFEKMEGNDPTALIGLPLIRLCAMLRNRGICLP